MKWFFLNTGANTGEYNMKTDIHFAENFKEGEGVFRLYRWNPYCISLGANQRLSSINVEAAAQNNIDVVYRPTGGRAVLHSEELTYSVIYPLDFTSSARDIYHNINLALLKGLKLYSPRMDKVELETTQPDFASIYKKENNVACFAVSAKSEIQYEGRKLVGSAQRKMERVILQHGSILCDSFHKKITEFLNLDVSGLSEVKKEIEEHTVDLKEIAGEEINYEKLADCLQKGFAEHFGIPESVELIESEI
jgi:lipoate-protein ligase A